MFFAPHILQLHHVLKVIDFDFTYPGHRCISQQCGVGKRTLLHQMHQHMEQLRRTNMADMAAIVRKACSDTMQNLSL